MPVTSLEACIPVRINDKLEENVARKVRIAGRLLCYDPLTGLALVTDQFNAILVDMRLCNEPLEADHWCRQLKCQLMILGYLERTSDHLEIPILPPYVEAPEVESTLVIRAIHVKAVETLDLRFWNAAIQGREEFDRVSSRNPKTS